MPASKKTTTKKTITRKSTLKTDQIPTESLTSTPVMTTPRRTKPKLNSKFLTIALIIIGIALLTYKFGPWLVPAIIDNRPVTRFELWSRMEKSFGAQTLDDVVNEYTLDAAIKKNGVVVEQDKIDTQMADLEKQFEGVGGLEEALTQRGLTRADLEKQVRTQLSVEKILSDQVEPTDEEVQEYFDTNAETLYADKEFDEVKDQVKATVKESNLRTAFLEWFATVKEEAKVTNFGL